MWLKSDEKSCPMGQTMCDAGCNWCHEPERNMVFRTLIRDGPRWKRSIGINSKGIVFFPAAITGNEKTAVLFAWSEDVPAAFFQDHAYLPIYWLKQVRPKYADSLEALQQKINKPHGWKS